MRIAIAGSIATDHLMVFEGRFADSLMAEHLDKISVSFLVDRLEIRRGGVAPNMAFAMGNLGLRPLLVGAVGEDFVDYRSWLERHGVDCSAVRVSELKHTARFVCTTDSEQAQIASFYAGAMSEARDIEIAPLHAADPIDLMLIGADDPEGMLRHTEECRLLGIPFAADPSQQLAWSDGDLIRQLLDGATYLFSNAYESELIEQKTGWSSQEVLKRVGTRITTRGSESVLIQTQEAAPIEVPVVPAARLADPTGVGDAFRGGYLAGLAWGLTPERGAQVGCLVATLVLETVGTQEYTLGREAFLARLAENYGDDAAAEVEPHLRAHRP